MKHTILYSKQMVAVCAFTVQILTKQNENGQSEMIILTAQFCLGERYMERVKLKGPMHWNRKVQQCLTILKHFA